ncbi:adhesion G protein-coupled receptor F5-like isoform X1 [Tachysurus ichikawai]
MMLRYINHQSSTSSYTLEYIVVVEINVSEVILIQQLQAIGLGSIVQLDNTTKISTVNVTTVCQLNNTGYQCRCENQYFWPCDKCMQYGQCNGTNKSSCYCINGVPNDGQFCQPLTGISSRIFHACWNQQLQAMVAQEGQVIAAYHEELANLQASNTHLLQSLMGPTMVWSDPVDMALAKKFDGTAETTKCAFLLTLTQPRSSESVL